MSKINIDVHVFTAGMGGAGKTTSMLNALAYFVDKQNSNTNILVFDEGDNTDFAALWAPYMRTGDLQDQFRHDYSQLSIPNSPKILAFEPFPLASRGLKWKSFGQIVDAHIDALEEKPHNIVALVDTGGALGPIIRNAGKVSSLNSKYRWRFFPWILWTANSLANSNYIETTRLGLNELEEAVKKYETDRSWKVYPIHVFNPIINESSSNKSGFINQLADFAMPNRSPLVAIDTLFAYKRRPIGRVITGSEFFELLQFAFVESGVINLPLPPLDIYRIIGKTLNLRFLDTNCKNGPCGYSNIFCIGIYDRQLAPVKLSPGLVRKKLQDYKDKAFEEVVSPVSKLSEFFGEIFGAYQFNLDALYKVIGK